MGEARHTCQLERASWHARRARQAGGRGGATHLVRRAGARAEQRRSWRRRAGSRRPCGECLAALVLCAVLGCQWLACAANSNKPLSGSIRPAQSPVINISKALGRVSDPPDHLAWIITAGHTCAVIHISRHRTASAHMSTQIKHALCSPASSTSEASVTTRSKACGGARPLHPRPH